MVAILKKLSLISLIALSFDVLAERFSNSYVSFELPSNWTCNREHTETVCTSRFSKKAKEAIIILTAKEAGPSDTFASYLNHLKTAKNIASKDGKIQPSKVLHVRERNISNHKWIDGMQLGSEVTSYYTRYLATIKDRIAILVTFSAHKVHYTKYSKDFIRAVESLRVVADKNLLSNRPNLAIRGNNETIGAPIGQILPQHAIQELPDEETGFISKYGTTILGLLFLLLAIGIYAYLKLDVGAPKKKKRKKR